MLRGGVEGLSAGMAMASVRQDRQASFVAVVAWSAECTWSRAFELETLHTANTAQNRRKGERQGRTKCSR